MELDKLPQPIKNKKIRRKVEKRLGMEKGKLDGYLDSGSVQFVEDYPPYLRFRRPVSQAEKGTNVFFKEENEEAKIDIVRGYPKTARLLMVEKGLEKNFDSKVHVEEKLNGYNVRLATMFNEVKALTRGGLDCPYTNEKIDKERYQDFFSENPDLMLCGEVIGQDNPYVEKEYPEEKDFGYYVFDVRNKETCEPLNVSEKNKLLDDHGINRVNEVMTVEPDEGRKVLDKVREMGREGREGVVLKSEDMNTQLKYTANESTNTELEYAFKFWNEYGRDFMFRRIIREGFQAHEKGLKGEKLKDEAAELGESILIPLVETIREIDEGKEVKEDFKLTVPTKEFAEAYAQYLNHIGIKAEVVNSEEKEDGVEVQMERKYQSTNDKTRNYLEGNTAKE